MDAILVVNAGSSSLKFQIFTVSQSQLTRQIRGQLDGIGQRPRLRASDAKGTSLIDLTFQREEVLDLPVAIDRTRSWLRSLEGFNLLAIGHRVVHGGPDYAAPTIIDHALLDKLATYAELAPLHQPNNLLPIRLAMEINPDVPQIACFDTAFHRNHPDLADFYALPLAFHGEGIRRYGFHGLSYEYVAGRLRQIAPQLSAGRVIVAHLGSGASMCALLDGHSVESTMGFTALDGLPMGTRPGQLDPGVVLHLIMQKGMSAEAVSKLLYHEAGLKGLSGISNDMRDLLASEDPRAAFAIEHFVYRCALNIGSLTAALGGLDAFVFTAGIGENAPELRERIVRRMAWLGAELDPKANTAGSSLISTPGSRIGLYIVPTDEELMIAGHTLRLITATH
ncbi:Acetate kinase [Hyphomicrobiales bacterium]|nr:Acetate kinase [Hyphomicrobiales bacterium]CAH1699626.1 Acetate kinase [Hyphomicrobiales bacterium]CAI0343361.1 Acetate kinase [Hyphomicrobiales bacterium]